MKKKGQLVKKITAVLLDRSENSEKRFEFFLFLLFLCFGTYQSILYYGHQIVPNPDFPDFIEVGKALLAFQLPESFKRAPLLGILQVLLSYIVGGSHPCLTAGWLLNAFIHPFNIVLFWLISKRIVAKSASPWMAVIFIMNPWVISSLTQPIAETVLLFFFLLTFWLVFKRSRLSYLSASLAAVTRYEGIVLVLLVFVMDLIHSKDRREWLWAFLYSVAASIPFALWMLLTVINWHNEHGAHYLQELGAFSDGENTYLGYLKAMWLTGFYPLSVPFLMLSKKFVLFAIKINQIVVVIGFATGCIYGLTKRNWNVIVMLLFLVPYLCIHAIHSSVLPRYCMPVFWIAILIFFYGCQNCWKAITANNRIPLFVVLFLQRVLLMSVLVWLILLIPFLQRQATGSLCSVSMVYVCMAVLVLIFVAGRVFYGIKYCWRDLIILIVVCFLMVSNQFLSVRVVGNGSQDIEFKFLSDWYRQNAAPGEKMVTTFAGILAIYNPECEKNFVHHNQLTGKDFNDFTETCHRENITYVTWDSRKGFEGPNEHNYELWKMATVDALKTPKDIGPYKYITSVYRNQDKFIHIFQLQKKQPAL